MIFHLKHRVEVVVVGFDADELLDAAYSADAHVLCYLDGVGAPRSDHFLARSEEITFNGWS